MYTRAPPLGSMDTKIGQYAYSAPSIFNFYLPDHTPAGPASKASLYAPEAEILMEGGADSYSMLIPLSGCSGGRDMYSEYAAVRGNVALTTSQILPMVPVDPSNYENNTQPCTTFGTHPNLAMVQTLWDVGEAAWFANIGSLVEPLTLEQWNTGRKENRLARKPPSLFGHDTQQVSVCLSRLLAKGKHGISPHTLTHLTPHTSISTPANVAVCFALSCPQLPPVALLPAVTDP